MALFPKRLSVKIPLLLVSVGVVPLILLATISSVTAFTGLETRIKDNLNSVAALKEQQIRFLIKQYSDHFTDIQSDIEHTSGHALATDEPGYRNAVSEELVRIASKPGYSIQVVNLLDPVDGTVVLSSDEEWVGKYQDDKEFFKQGKSELFVSDIFHSPTLGQPTLVISGPIYDSRGELQWVLSTHLALDDINAIMLQREGLSATTETFVVNKYNLLITDTVFAPNGAFHTWIFGEGVERAKRGERGAGTFTDYRGEKVIGSYRWIDELQVALIVKQDYSEAVASMAGTPLLIGIVALVIAGVSSLLAYYFYQSIRRPLRELSRGAITISSGNLNHRVPINSQDEIGDFSAAFNQMIDDLQKTMASRDELNKEVAERKQAEEALRREIQTRAALLDNLPFTAMILKKDTREIVASNQAARTIGAVPGKTCYQTCANRDDPCPFCKAPQMWDTGESCETQVLHQGTHFHGIWVPLDENHYVHYVLDISERKFAEEALREKTAEAMFLAQLLNDSSQPFVERNTDGRILKVNRAYCEMTGYSESELLSSVTWSETLTPPEWRDHEAQMIQKLAATGEPQRYEKQFIRKDGAVISVELLLHRNLNAEGSHRSDYAFVTDITERKQAEEQLAAYRNHLEEMVEQRTEDLNLANAELREAAETLAESEQRFHSLVDNIQVGVVRSTPGPDAKLIEFNPAMEKITGYSREELLSMDPADIYMNPEERKELVGNIEAGQNQITAERWMRKQDGTPIWIRSYITAVRNESGQVIYMDAVLEDITERMQAIEELAASENRYRSLFDNMLNGFAYCRMVMDDDGQPVDFVYLEINDAFERITGLERDKVVKRPVSEVIPGTRETAPELFEIYGKVATTAEPAQFEIYFAPLSKWLTISVYCPERGYFVAIFGDISERKQAEEALRASEQKYRAIFDKAKDGIVLFDVETSRLLDFNEQAHTNLGYTREEFAALTIADFEVNESGNEVLAHARSVVNSGSSSFETKHRTKNGEIRDVIVDANPIVLDGRTVIQSTLQDVTERHRAEEEKRRLEHEAHLAHRLAAIGEIAAGVAHELNNPLGGILGFCELLLEGELPAETRRDLEVIRSESQRAAQIVRQLLTYARGRQPNRQRVDINDIVETALRLRSYEIESNNIKLELALAADIPATAADAGQLQQVFLNLMINAELALKTMRRQRKLTISTEAGDGMIRITVKDNGPGMGEADLEKIFDPFFSTRSTAGGTGLGLSVSQSIVKAHGGHIQVLNDPKRGATFIVELPVTEPMRWPEDAAPGETHTGQTTTDVRVLVVDDEPRLQEFIRRVLAADGYEVDTVGRGDDALKYIGENDYALIFLDIRLPDMSGIDVYRQLRRRSRSLARKVIFMTGGLIDPDISQFFFRTNAPRLTKPFTPSRLRAEASQALRETPS